MEGKRGEVIEHRWMGREGRKREVEWKRNERVGRESISGRGMRGEKERAREGHEEGYRKL
jgi:hypothetical protein